MGLSSYERHVQGVEERFHERFPEWAERKVRWENLYRKRGWFRTMTGFVCRGDYSRNELFNFPVQGPAFHVLLWSLIETVRRLRRRKMRSKVIAEIHDTMLGDVHRDELNDYLAMVRSIMTEEVRRHWSWIVTPLEIEVEMAETNWFEKRKVA